MFASDDTIVAIATPPGRGGIGVVRVSGARALETVAHILARTRDLEPRRATRTTVRSVAGASTTDHAVVTWFPSPNSYTGEHVVEISAHGSPVVLGGIVTGLIDGGARLAQPGEFTLRAFLNGKLDLIQAEAVADLINAATPLQARTAYDQLEGTLSVRIGEIDRALLDLVARLEASLDFPEEGFHFIEPGRVARRVEGQIRRIDEVLSQAERGRVIREGATVVIVGRTNVGKSSLFNALLGRERAIVTAIAGTTRDLVTESVEIDGLAINLVDTAGIRQTSDAVEREGVARALQAQSVADLTLVVLDSGEELQPEDRSVLERSSAARRVVVANKADREPKWRRVDSIRVSPLMNTGMNDLRAAMMKVLTGEETLRDSVTVSNMRHVRLLREAREALWRAHETVTRKAPEEFVLVDLHHARKVLSEVVGPGADDEVLEHIFGHFCVGK